MTHEAVGQSLELLEPNHPVSGANASAALEPAPSLPLDSVGRPEATTVGARISRANYLSRHWRGDLSLPVSYWVNGCLLGIGNLVGILLVLHYPSRSITFAISVYVVVVLTWAIQVWQLVGIWRSAKKHTDRGGWSFWARTAQVTAICGWAYWAVCDHVVAVLLACYFGRSLFRNVWPRRQGNASAET
jgi:hypothetical protein